jgi:hypothetical protein
VFGHLVTRQLYGGVPGVADADNLHWFSRVDRI